jgi:hypothetical protein
VEAHGRTAANSEIAAVLDLHDRLACDTNKMQLA